MNYIFLRFFFFHFKKLFFFLSIDDNEKKKIMGEVWRWQFLWNSSLFKLMEVKKWWWKVVVVAFWGSASGCWMASIGWCWGDLCWCVEVSLRPDFCCCCWWQLRIRVEWGEKASIKTQREDDSLTMAQESSPPSLPSISCRKQQQQSPVMDAPAATTGAATGATVAADKWTTRNQREPTGTE